MMIDKPTSPDINNSEPRFEAGAGSYGGTLKQNGGTIPPFIFGVGHV
jgi:hypothetical protein